MPEANPKAPVVAESLARLSLNEANARVGADSQQWGNPTCPTCICMADQS